MGMDDKICPIVSIPTQVGFCPREKCALWVSDWVYPKDEDAVDKGWCAFREIASLLGYLRAMDREE